MSNKQNLIKELVSLCGGGSTGANVIAKRCGLGSYQAVMKWVRADKLPRTEYSAETSYAKTLSEIAKEHGREWMPIDFAQGAGQYMFESKHKEAA